MKKINKVIATHSDKKLFEITPEMEEEDNKFEEFLADASQLNVNVQKYICQDADEDDVEQSTNSWCLNQSTMRGKASDNIVIITDLDELDWFILIERKNGPGRSQAAWAGGFVDGNETFTEAALREKDEETDIVISHSDNIKMTAKITEIPVIISKDWDPRAKFVEGMENGAVVTQYSFFNNNHIVDGA
jgi:NADH pyrophosphatase NudC (nudix superfamily)